MKLGTDTCGELSYLFMMNELLCPPSGTSKMRHHHFLRKSPEASPFPPAHPTILGILKHEMAPYKCMLSCQAHLRNTHVALSILWFVSMICIVSGGGGGRTTSRRYINRLLKSQTPTQHWVMVPVDWFYHNLLHFKVTGITIQRLSPRP